jgi:hypothetical protein
MEDPLVRLIASAKCAAFKSGQGTKAGVERNRFAVET